MNRGRGQTIPLSLTDLLRSAALGERDLVLPAEHSSALISENQRWVECRVTKAFDTVSSCKYLGVGAGSLFH